MIAWMLRTLLATAAVAAAAVLVDALVRRLGLPRRPVWATSLALAAVLPAFARLLPAMPPAPALSLPPDALDALLAGATSAAPSARPFPVGWLIGGAWALASGGLLAALAYAAWRLRRLCAAWPTTRLDDGDVVLSTGAGPLVLGVRRPRVVVPPWVVQAPEAERRMVLAHEREHVRAGDARLLAAAALVPALEPWNLPAWWLVRRLREAVETDCDRRVLAGGFAPAEYGRLLLSTAAGPRLGVLPAAALAEPKRLLERRLIAMTEKASDRRLRRLLPLALGAAALLVVACEMARPDASAPVSPVAPKASAAGSLAADRARGYAQGCVAGAVDAVGPRRDSAAVAEVLDQTATCLRAQAVALQGVECASSKCREAVAQFRMAQALFQRARAPGQAATVEVRTKDGLRMVTVRKPTNGPEAAPAAQAEGQERQMVTARRPLRPGEVEATPANVYVELNGKAAAPGVLKTLDPTRIQSINVLKGPAAAAHLGKDDGRAVIQITTK